MLQINDVLNDTTQFDSMYFKNKIVLIGFVEKMKIPIHEGPLFYAA